MTQFPILRIDANSDGVMLLSGNEAGIRELHAACEALLKRPSQKDVFKAQSALFVQDDPQNPERQKKFSIGITLHPNEN